LSWAFRARRFVYRPRLLTILNPLGDLVLSQSAIQEAVEAVRRASRPRRAFLKGLGAAATLASPLAGLRPAFAEGEEPVAPTEEPAVAPEMPVEGVPVESAPVVEPVPGPAPAPAPVVQPFAYGMQAHLYYQDVPKVLDYVRGAGFGWVKQQVRWSVVEPSPGEYDWSQLDSIVGYAALMGTRVLFSVVTAPAWSRAAGGVDGPPDDYSLFGKFLSTLATRYTSAVHAYEVWNEQNFSREWGGGRINAGEYVELLKVAYPAIKSVDPNAVVISGALTPTGFVDPNIAIDDVLYLREMYGYEGGVLATICDGVGAHAGGFNNPPEDTPFVKNVTSTTFKGHESFYFQRLKDLRAVMEEFGDVDRKMWVTEFGWSTENLAPGYEYGKDNTETDQANYLERAFQIGHRWGWIKGMFVWNLNFQQVVPPTDEKFPFGIIRPDGSPRPAYAKLKNMLKWP
jgi:hypothetical protein